MHARRHRMRSHRPRRKAAFKAQAGRPSRCEHRNRRGRLSPAYRRRLCGITRAPRLLRGPYRKREHPQTRHIRRKWRFVGRRTHPFDQLRLQPGQRSHAERFVPTGIVVESLARHADARSRRYVDRRSEPAGLQAFTRRDFKLSAPHARPYRPAAKHRGWFGRPNALQPAHSAYRAKPTCWRGRPRIPQACKGICIEQRKAYPHSARRIGRIDGCGTHIEGRHAAYHSVTPVSHRHRDKREPSPRTARLGDRSAWALYHRGRLRLRISLGGSTRAHAARHRCIGARHLHEHLLEKSRRGISHRLYGIARSPSAGIPRKHVVLFMHRARHRPVGPSPLHATWRIRAACEPPAHPCPRRARRIHGRAEMRASRRQLPHIGPRRRTAPGY